MERHETNHLSILHQKLKEPEENPYDLNDLCNFNFSFDVLKKAIEFLSKQQREQQTMLVDLIESLRERDVPAANDTRSEKSEKSEKKPVVVEKVVEKVIERVPSDLKEQKDWTPLMNDFDRRLDAMDKRLKAQDATNASGKQIGYPAAARILSV